MYNTVMSKRDAYQRYLDAGIAFTQMTRSRAEELVQELVKSGEVQRKEAQAKVEELIDRSRKSSESLLSVVRDEVGNQLHSLGISNIEDLAKQVASLLARSPKPASGSGQEGRGQEGPRQEGCGEEGTGQEGRRQEVCGQQVRRERDLRLSPVGRRRLDRALVDRGLAESRQQAANLIDQRLVLVSGAVADKPARLVAAGEPIELARPRAALREPGRGEAPSGSRPVFHRRDRRSGFGRGCVDRRVHRLPVAVGRRLGPGGGCGSGPAP